MNTTYNIIKLHPLNSKYQSARRIRPVRKRYNSITLNDSTLIPAFSFVIAIYSNVESVKL